MDETDTWQVFGYKNNKGKKPKNMGNLYFGEAFDRARALKAAQNIFCFSVVTDVVATKYTRWDAFMEGVRSLMWLWLSALIVISGLIICLTVHVLAGVLVSWFGFAFGVAYAPHSPV